LRKDTRYIFDIFSLSISCIKRRACEGCKNIQMQFAENYKFAHTWLLNQSLPSENWQKNTKLKAWENRKRRL